MSNLVSKDSRPAGKNKGFYQKKIKEIVHRYMTAADIGVLLEVKIGVGENWL